MGRISPARIKVGTFVKVRWLRYPQLVVAKEGSRYILWDDFAIRKHWARLDEIERIIRPNPNAPIGSLEELAARVRPIAKKIEYEGGRIRLKL